MLTIGVLGAVEALRDGDRLPLPSGKTTELLARLALDAGSPVRVDVLVEDLWAEPTDRNTLQSKVSQLRRALGDKELVLATADAYVLAIEPSAVDAVRVAEIAAATERARAVGDHAAVATWAREGTELFRGEVLPAAGPWATPYRTRLEETRWALVENLMEARVALGAGGEVVADLERLVAEQPLRERLWVTLVTALYRAGRQADALDACARVRRHLVDELGLDPGTELRAVERQVLEQSPALAAPETRATTLASPGNLPPATAPLVGRLTDLTALGNTLDGHRLVTVVGPAGVGKTRLASEVARASMLPGGAWMVRLDSVDEGADLARVVAETLHVTGGEQALVERLAGAETLLVLDNCEHVVGPVAGVVAVAAGRRPRPAGPDDHPGRRSGWTRKRSTRSRRCRPPSRSRCSRSARSACARSSPWTSGPGRWSRRSAARSTACRSRSSSPRRGCARSRSRRSRGGSTTGSPCSATRAATSQPAGEPWRRPSTGATTCCSPTTSGGCGRCRASPAGPRSTPSSGCSARSTSRRPRCSTP